MNGLERGFLAINSARMPSWFVFLVITVEEGNARYVYLLVAIAKQPVTMCVLCEKGNEEK